MFSGINNTVLNTSSINIDTVNNHFFTFRVLTERLNGIIDAVKCARGSSTGGIYGMIVAIEAINSAREAVKSARGSSTGGIYGMIVAIEEINSTN